MLTLGPPTGGPRRLAVGSDTLPGVPTATLAVPAGEYGGISPATLILVVEVL